MSKFGIHREVFEQILGRVRIKRFTTMRVPFTLCRGHVVETLAVYGRAYGHTGVTEFTQDQVHRCVTYLLKGYGMSVIAGAIPPNLRQIAGGDHIDQNDERWAEAQIARFWPRTEEDL